MKIAVSAEEDNPNAQLAPAFGKSKFFIIFDPDEERCDSILNPGYGLSSGAGAAAAISLKTLGVEKVITGRVGPKTRPLLEEAGIVIVENQAGNVGDILSSEAVAFRCTTGNKEPNNGRLTKKNPAGYCFCDLCGYQNNGAEGVPCFKLRCPNCARSLERKYD